MVLIDNFEFLSGWLLNWRGNFWPTRTQIHPLIENTEEKFKTEQRWNTEEKEEKFKTEKRWNTEEKEEKFKTEKRWNTEEERYKTEKKIL